MHQILLYVATDDLLCLPRCFLSGAQAFACYDTAICYPIGQSNKVLINLILNWISLYASVRQCSIKPQIQSSRPVGRLWAGTRRIDTSSEAFHRHHVHGPQPAGRIIIFPIGPYCCCTTSISKEIEPVSGLAPIIRPNFVQTAPLPSRAQTDGV